ncbi:Hypothetical protein NTJ_07049 [Nesidiocoris tenuis]|uniref:PiggyBac transposable element-derived protein domain-containing protein n=1 Tax=Nesidiocoris tenuis TaxID=355587 RepID=A0ABN7APU9_9HEMI|nr:Hypothetical protein NTJ_07049 [Nesidiocoris tenuis]
MASCSDSEDIDDPLLGEDDLADETFVPNFDSSDDDGYLESDESDDCRHARNPSKFLMSSNSYTWHQIAKPPEAFQRVNSNCDEQISSRSVYETYLDPSQVFSKMFTESFATRIVTMSNLDPDDGEASSLNLTQVELKAFVGMLIIMGFHRLPSIRHYWRDDKNFAVPRISSIMALNRFLQILKSLRFATRSTTDKKSLIDPLVGHINKTFCQLRSPKGWLTLDESELQSRTANYFSKKRRITISSLCCSKSGYLFKMSPQYPSLSMNEVAEAMLSTYENSGQSVVLGKRHSNFVLAERLFEKKLFVCTRLSVHDPNISKLFPRREQTSEEGDFRQSGNFSVTKWKNRKQYLYILSTRHDPSATKSVLRSNDKNSKELVNCRETVLDYNNYKSGVELFDHLTHAYSTSWRSSDWTRRFFFFFLDAALVNSYILYTEAWQQLKSDEGTEKKLNPLDFRSRIADQLIGSFMTRKRPASTSAPLVKRLKRGLTFYIDESTMHLPTKCTSRRCVHCSSAKEPRRSTTMCSDCQVVLCLDCYTPFHTNSTVLESDPNL